MDIPEFTASFSLDRKSSNSSIYKPDRILYCEPVIEDPVRICTLYAYIEGGPTQAPHCVYLCKRKE